MPSSLTMLLPPALGFSPHPPVSVYGTGTCHAIAAFLGTPITRFATIFRSALRLRIAWRVCQPYSFFACTGFLFPGSCTYACVPTVLMTCSTGIFTCCPSDTCFHLSLGPDLPRADQLYPGNLGYSAGRILTFLSLLIPAFSLHSSPPLLPVWLPSAVNAPLPLMLNMNPKLRCRVSAPDIFGAGPLD